MLAAILLVTIALFWVAYRVYGGWMGRVYGLNDQHLVPSEAQYDGVDHVPTKTQVLLGHHFSSIAGAGPIVGPILAGLFFGWLPALVWIVAGSILVGGVHDFGAAIASVRHKAKSVAELARQYITPRAYKLFLAFIWLALMYVIVVFMDLTAATFVNVEMNGSGVAISAIIFVGLALAMGFLIYRRGVGIKAGTLVFLPLLLLAIWIGDAVGEGAGLLPWIAGSEKNTWNLVLLAYCLIASITPVWILLQPRDYLSSWLLYLSVVGAGLGLLIGGLTGATAVASRWPAVVLPSEVTGLGIAHIGPLFPILFITVACGACSGFHSIVASGTTSKQISRETDTRRVGYGAMLIEGVVAVIALSAVIILPFSGDAFGETPITIYAGGIGEFLARLGIPSRFGAHFGLLALSTFLLTTLDTCTRLGRYAVQEAFALDKNDARSRVIATVVTLLLPGFLVFMTYADPATGQVLPAWRAVWPVFGATNQLLAALALLSVTVWLKRTGRTWVFAGAPMAFMLVMTMTALAMLIWRNGLTLIGVISSVLFVLGLFLAIEAARAFRLHELGPEPVTLKAVGASGD
ncbi:MAG: carbon starvation protein A [Gemmatimonadota bacterium]|nr:MAG: carbon starvation protein A [Gemmatimonadota bacterium]